MSNIILKNNLSVEEKIDQMRIDSFFDVESENTQREFCIDENALQKIKSPSAPPTVPKMFLSNNCVFNCAYCGCRATKDGRKYCNEPATLASLAVEEAKRNGRGVFITSAIDGNPNRTEELIVETLKIMRQKHEYKGYIHAKIMPGTDPRLIFEAGKYANRLSVNIEVAQSEGYKNIAKQKNKTNILSPMNTISELIKQENDSRKFFGESFASSQTTQLMAGGAGEDDFTIMNLSEALYRKFSLKRVYYTPFTYRGGAVGYDTLEPVLTPRWRMRRLYQADRLMQVYGYTPREILPESSPMLEIDLDPKTSSAIRNLEKFPVELNTADYETLLRVPGIGIIYAKRILEARKYCGLTHEILFKKIGVSPKKSVFFITCSGKYLGGKMIDNQTILRTFVADIEVQSKSLYEQLSLF